MTKLSFLFEEEEIKSYFPEHVKEIVNFLIERGYKIECYKNINNSKYILKYNFITAEFKSCKDIVLFLKDIYFQERENSANEYYKQLLKRELLK